MERCGVRKVPAPIIQEGGQEGRNVVCFGVTKREEGKLEKDGTGQLGKRTPRARNPPTGDHQTTTGAETYKSKKVTAFCLKREGKPKKEPPSSTWGPVLEKKQARRRALNKRKKC